MGPHYSSSRRILLTSAHSDMLRTTRRTEKLRKDPNAFQPQRYDTVIEAPAKCCDDGENSFLDQASAQCLACPEGSRSRNNGYYCERCPPGAEPATLPIGCHLCKPGFFKPEPGNSTC